MGLAGACTTWFASLAKDGRFCYFTMHLRDCSRPTNFFFPSMQANLPYVLWIVAFNTSFILAFYFLDMIFFPARISKVRDPSDPSGKRILQEDPTASTSNSAPALLEAINRNGLATFLVVSPLPSINLPINLRSSLYSGQRCNRAHQSVNPDNVYTKRKSVAHIAWVFFRYMPICLDIPQ